MPKSNDFSVKLMIIKVTSSLTVPARRVGTGASRIPARLGSGGCTAMDARLSTARQDNRNGQMCTSSLGDILFNEHKRSGYETIVSHACRNTSHSRP